ncbi:PREDICTED: putative gustatory receptor 28b [Vollenhovia emeryi]|uniref:putative gustatory receptor 28b n=1 Tax=Vollenhovia emeryi TaxID=411798 RepID=UPI0005F58663|nr:PREDICTED: putative gustatory receptor 28b [Vollenhovia emeryi]
MTSEMASYLPYLTALFYYLYMMLVQEHRDEIYTIYDWFNIGLWVFIFLIRIYIVNYTCESVTVKAKEINKTIHQLTNILQNNDIKKEIHQFTLQTLHHPVRFTGMGLFNFGYKFLRKFYTAILMYVIIMVQFKIPNSY